MIGSAITYLWFFQEINHNFPVKEDIVNKIKSSLLKSDADFMHATSNDLRVFPIYFSEGNCVLVRPGKPIAFNSKEIIYCFDKNWRGAPQRVRDVTLHMQSDLPEKVAQWLYVEPQCYRQRALPEPGIEVALSA